MTINWEVNFGTMIHLGVLLVAIIGFWVKLSMKLARFEEREKQHEANQHETKQALCELNESVQELKIANASMSTSLKNLVDRINHHGMKIVVGLFLAYAMTPVYSADFTASTFFQTPIIEGGEVKPAGGINLRGTFWRGFGADVDLIQSATEDTFVDRTAAHLTYLRNITGSLDALAFAGGAWDAEDKEHGIEAGAGLEYSFESGIVLGANVRWQKDDTDDHVIVPTVGAGWKF